MEEEKARIIPGSDHPTGKTGSMSDIQHERHDPPANTNFNAHVDEEEHSRDPCDTLAECFEHSPMGLLITATGIFCTEDGASVGPECERGRKEFESSYSDLILGLLSACC